MPISVSSTLIAAQSQTYAPSSKKDVAQRSYAPPPVEKPAPKPADRGADDAVRIELSAEAQRADRARVDSRDNDRRAEARADARADDEQAVERDFAREAPLRSAQQDAGARNTRPGTNLDLSI